MYTAPHYRTVLAGMSEYLPDAQAGRDFYFLGRSQATTLNPVVNIGAGYVDRAHLLQPSSSRTGYGSRIAATIADVVKYEGIRKGKPASDGIPLPQPPKDPFERLYH